jgi:hypothetical protein
LTVERVVFSEPADALSTRRSKSSSFPHFGGPLDAHWTQATLRQIEERVPLSPKHLDPQDLGLPEFLQPLHPLEFVGDDVVAVVDSEPVVERRLPPRPSDFDVLP